MDKPFKRPTLATKLRPPAVGVRHMPRPRLSVEPARVDSIRLALVCAPAGSGKTTVLSEWYRALRGRRKTAAWLSLDPTRDKPRPSGRGRIARTA